MNAHEGVHPAVGALDVCPLVWVAPEDRDAARAAATEVAAEMATWACRCSSTAGGRPGPARERASFATETWPSSGCGWRDGELRPDRGPALPHRTAGVTLVTARPLLGAFNVELDSDDLEVARAVAAGLGESGGGPRGVRAIGLPLSSGCVQVSTNVHDPVAVPLGEGGREGAGPRGAARGPPGRGRAGRADSGRLHDGIPRRRADRGFNPTLHTIERRLERLSEPPPGPLDSGDGPDEEEAADEAPRHAGGRVEARGRTGRRPGAGGARPAPEGARRAKVDQPPTWRSALNRALIAAALFLVLLLFFFRQLGPSSGSPRSCSWSTSRWATTSTSSSTAAAGPG